MRIVTANLLVDFEGDRTCEFLQTGMLVHSSPDIIMLQELHYKRKEAVDKLLVDYVAQFPLTEGMGCMIYVRKTDKVDGIFYKKFSSTFMDRGIYAVKVLDVWYITTHLESMDKPQFEKNRQTQLQEMWDFIKDKSKVVIGMDSNIKESLTLPQHVIDIWDKDPVNTWFAGRFFDYIAECRFDRFLVKNVLVCEKDVITNRFSDHDMLYLNTQ